MDQTRFGASGTVKASGLSRFKRLRGLILVQFQFAVDAVHALVVPAMSPDIAQVKKAQAEAPDLLRPRQPDQEIGDLSANAVCRRARSRRSASRYNDNMSR